VESVVTGAVTMDSRPTESHDEIEEVVMVKATPPSR